MGSCHQGGTFALYTLSVYIGLLPRHVKGGKNDIDDGGMQEQILELVEFDQLLVK